MGGDQDQDKMGEGGLVFVLPRRIRSRDFGSKGLDGPGCHPNVVRSVLQEVLGQHGLG